MQNDAWVTLTRQEDDLVWGRIYENLGFHPSTLKEDGPAYIEPIPSITWDISRQLDLFDPWLDAEAVPYAKSLLTALRMHTAPLEPVFALDWQHEGYYFFPHLAPDDAAIDFWKIPPLPSGGYHIFLAKDFRFGVLGHPWESTVCVFGKGFLDTFISVKPPQLEIIFRCDGKGRY